MIKKASLSTRHSPVCDFMTCPSCGMDRFVIEIVMLETVTASQDVISISAELECCLCANRYKLVYRHNDLNHSLFLIRLPR